MGLKFNNKKGKELSKVIQEKTLNFYQLEHQNTGLLNV